MKYILAISLLTSIGCKDGNEKLYYLGDRVEFKHPPFFKRCLKVGKIVKHHFRDYVIKITEEQIEGCPETVIRSSKHIKGVIE